MKPPSPKTKLPSLADYLVRYDLAAMLDEARQDYNQSTSGGPRHLDQKDIAARFQNLRRAPKAPNE
jgi:hypothetical protein